MNTLLRVARWKLYLAFLLPLVTMLVLTNADVGEEARRRSYNFHFYTVFGLLTALLIVLWQYAVGLALFKRTGSPAWFFKSNGLVPVVFYLLLLRIALYQFSHFLMAKGGLADKTTGGVRHPVDFGYITKVSQQLVGHSLLTLWVNQRRVGKEM